MNITRWNIMRLVFFVLIVKNSLTQAETITSLSPTRVQPGQVVMLQGRFNAANFQNRKYRFSLNKRRSPRHLQGAINGYIETLRVTATTAVVRIPATWQRKPVYPGEYVLSIKDASRNRSLFNGIPLNVINTAALGAAKTTARNQINQRQQQRIGGNLSQTTRPRLPLTSRAPQMKLTLTGLKVHNRDIMRSSVSIGDDVLAKLEIQNLGTVTARVKVGYMNTALVNARPLYTTNGFVTVAPGQRVTTLMNVIIKERNFDRNINRRAWNPVFRLLTTRNTIYRDSNMADNIAVRNSIPLKAIKDLAIVSIEGIKLKESYLGGQQWDDGTIHPVSLEFLVKIKNNGSQTSRVTNLSLTVMGKKSAITAALNDPGVERHSIGRCAYWPICTLNKELPITAIASGRTETFRVSFNNLPHQIVISKRHYRRVAVGPYICAWDWDGGNVLPGRISISAFLRQANVDEAPSFRRNNSLILQGKFGRLISFRRGNTVSSCGIENTTSRAR